MSVSPCLKYYVHLSDDNTPILGTMFATTEAHGQASCQRKIATVPTFQRPLIQECRPKSGLRYFYKMHSVTGQILPNSLFAMRHRPTSMCSGQYRIMEFVVTNNAS